MQFLNRLWNYVAPAEPPSEPRGPFVAVSVDYDVFQEAANRSLRVSEVWVVSEPIQQQQLQLANKVAEHYFLVFKLEPGENVYGHEYQYLRVERQQASDQSKGEALLNIRFGRDPITVQGLDLPVEDVQLLKEEDLGRYKVKQRCKVFQQPLSPAEGHLGLLLGNVAEAVVGVHKQKPKYHLTDANCLWFVDRVIEQLMAEAPPSSSLHMYGSFARFKQHPRVVFISEVVPSTIQVARKLKGLFAAMMRELFTGAPGPANKTHTRPSPGSLLQPFKLLQPLQKALSMFTLITSKHSSEKIIKRLTVVTANRRSFY